VDHTGDFDIIGANYNSESDPHGAPLELCGISSLTAAAPVASLRRNRLAE